MRAFIRLCSLQRRPLTLAAGCGVSLLCLVSLSCARPSRQNDAPVELKIGFAGANGASGTFGVGQFTAFLTVEGLTYQGPDGRAIPRLAESWEWQNDGLVLRMKLRRGVTFHDGTPLTSAVAIEILQKALTRPNVSRLYPSLAYVQSLTKINDYEFAFNLSQRSVFLLDDLTMPFEHGTNIGTGPYKVATVNGEPALIKYEPYYLGRPSIDRVVVRQFDAQRTAWSSMLRGEVDMLSEVPPDSVEFVQTDKVEIIAFPRSYQYLIAFNSHRAPFTSRTVRRALNLAIDRAALVQKVFQGYATPATGPLWPKHWAYDTAAAAYAFDPRTAATLLESEGLYLQPAPGPDRPPARVRFTCLIVSTAGLVEALALEVQKQLYDVGVDVQFERISAGELDSRIQEGTFDAVLTDMISGPTFGRPYLFWRSAKESKGYNVFGYEDPDAERLFQTLRTSMNEAEIRSATRHLQEVFYQDPPALFLAWTERLRAIRRDFKVVKEPDRDPMLTLWRWTPDTMVRTSRVSFDR